jgi:hypothetical protein
MFKYTIITLILILSHFGTSLCSAAPISYWNLDMLGFSSNSRFFILVESMAEQTTASARIIIMDVTKNQCLEGGCFFVDSTQYEPKNTQVESEEDLLEIVYSKSWRLRKKRKLTRPKIGYTTSGPFFDENNCKTAYYLFQDQPIWVTLKQDIIPYRRTRKASVQLEVSGENFSKTIDSIKNYRDQAQHYQLGRLFVSPNRKNLAILIHVAYYNAESESVEVRTLVQTAKWF